MMFINRKQIKDIQMATTPLEQLMKLEEQQKSYRIK